MFRKRKINPSGSSGKGPTDVGVWSTADKELLQQRLDGLKSENLKIRPFSFLQSPDARMLLCASKEDVFDRSTAYLLNFNIMSGLILSSIVGTALNPYDIAGMPEEKQTLGYVYNICGFIAVMVQVAMTMYSSLIVAMMYSLGSDPAMTYRFLLYAGRLFSAAMVLSFIPNLLIFVILIVQFQLNTPNKTIAWAVTVSGLVFFVAFHIFVGYAVAYAHPVSTWGWGPLHGLILPHMLCSQQMTDDTKRIGDILLADAQKGVLSSLDRDHDGGIDGEDAAASPEGVELDDWLAATLGARVKGKRRTTVVRAFLGEDLRLDTLRVAATKARLAELVEILKLDGQLTHGERLELAISLLPTTV